MLVIIIAMPLIIVRGCSLKQEPAPVKTEHDNIKIKVYISADKKVREMDLEEYIKGVVAAEMPAEFGIEALKAQAVAARTYAYGRIIGTYKAKEGVHDGIEICTDPAHCQAWISREGAFKKWGLLNSIRYWNKICKAVNETRDIIITCNNTVINPLFHSSSSGRTENSEDVWEGTAVPYLRSVISNGDDACRNYKMTVKFSKGDFVKRLKKQYSDIKISQKDPLKDVSILDYTVGGRVKTLKAGNVQMKGTDFRSIFSLRSASFSMEYDDKGNIIITTTGYGHGVGMSQWGANYLAGKGESYDSIIKYYYTGVELSSLYSFSQ